MIVVGLLTSLQFDICKLQIEKYFFSIFTIYSFYALIKFFCVLALKIKFHGKANVRWSESHSNGKTTTTRVYTAKETYFEHTVSLFGKGNLCISNCL